MARTLITKISTANTVTAGAFSPTVSWDIVPTINTSIWNYLRIENTVTVYGYVEIVTGGSSSSFVSVTVPIATTALAVYGGQLIRNVNTTTGASSTLVASGSTVVAISPTGTGSGGNTGHYTFQYSYEIN